MKRRYELSKFDFSEADAIGEHLSAMAEKGWQLDRAGPHLWRYQRCQPQKLRYALGYLPGIHTTAPLPQDQVDAFRALYEAAGWRFLTEWYFVQVFVTDDPGAVAPDTDEAVKLEALRRSVGKQMWLNVLMAALIALLMGLLIAASLRNPLTFLSSNSTLVLPWILLLIILSETAPMIRFFFWKRRARKALAEGGVCPPLKNRFRHLENTVLWIAVAIFVVAEIADACVSPAAAWSALRLLIWVAGLMALQSLNARSRRSSNDRWFFWIVFAAFIIVFLVITRLLPDGTEAKQVTQEALPLSAQDLGFEPDGSTYCSLEISQSVLLRHVEGADGTSSEWLFYDVYYPYTSWSHRLCRRLLERGTDWQPVADGIQLYSYTAPGDDGVNYLLETPDAIIVLYPPGPLDETQLATAIAHLSP